MRPFRLGFPVKPLDPAAESRKRGGKVPVLWLWRNPTGIPLPWPLFGGITEVG
jgi:hypothetical protein